MTGPIVAPVTLRSSTSAHARPSTARRVLPLAPVPTRRSNTIVYGMSAVDASGRVADQHILRTLGWAPGVRLDIQQGHGVLVVHATSSGMFAISGQGHLRLPASARHRLSIEPGDRLLLAACPAEQVLFLYSPTTLDEAFTTVHATLLGGDLR
jgi:hypothetical protein